MNAPNTSNPPSNLTRRDFLKTTSAAVTSAGVLGALSVERSAHAAGSDTLKIALVGCGGRGSGAADQALSTAGPIKLVAMADVFKDRLEGSLNELKRKHSDKIDVPPDRQFLGFDAYKQAIALADVVILATPPGFRPMTFEEAVKQNKNIFCEKPVATDAPGVRRFLAAAEESKKKNLKVGIGLQRHHDRGYLETMKRIQDGAIGDIVAMRSYWNGSTPWLKRRVDLEKQYGRKLTEMEYQMRNWYYFNWICGDHIVEQHIHNIDVVNWFKGDYPVKAQGMGGREVRKGKEFGEIFDHHYVEFQYADGTVLNSQCRHIKGTYSRVDEQIVGTSGTIFGAAKNITDRSGNVIFQFDKANENNPYQTEHDELFAAIAKGEYKFADADNAARSTMTAILGRLATYSGQMVEFDKALNSGLSIAPTVFEWNAPMPVIPDKEGWYPIAVPGVTKFFS